MPRKLDNKDKGKGVAAPCHVTYGQCTGQRPTLPPWQYFVVHIGLYMDMVVKTSGWTVGRNANLLLWSTDKDSCDLENGGAMVSRTVGCSLNSNWSTAVKHVLEWGVVVPCVCELILWKSCSDWSCTKHPGFNCSNNRNPPPPPELRMNCTPKATRIDSNGELRAVNRSCVYTSFLLHVWTDCGGKPSSPM
jgi:hypothetical protein